MKSPAQAVAWELFARNRWAILFAFGLIPLCAVVSVLAQRHEIVSLMHVLGALLSFTALVWACTYTGHDSRGAFLGFPSWMYTLPLRTPGLVLLPVALGWVLLLVAVVGWEAAIRAQWGLSFNPVHLGWHVVLAFAGLALVQAIIWSLYRFRWIRLAVLIATIFGLLYVALVAHTYNFPRGAWWWFGGVLLLIPGAVAMAVRGVGRDRRGGWQCWTGRLLERALDMVPRRTGSFASAARAQLWFEWRRRGWFLAATFAVPMGLSMFLLPLLLYLDPVPTMFNLAVPFLLLVFLGGVMGGTLAKSDPWSPDLALHPMVAARPQETSAVVFAKFKVAAIVTILAWVAFGFLLAGVVTLGAGAAGDTAQIRQFWAEFDVNFPGFWRWLSNPLVIVALLAVTWHTMVQTMTVVLTGDRRTVIISGWRGVTVITLVFACAIWLYKDRSRVDDILRFVPWFTGLMMVLKTFGAVRAFVAVKPLVSPARYAALLALWAAVGLLVVIAGALGQAAGGLPPALVWFFALWQFFPGGEIPACIVALHGNRHRWKNGRAAFAGLLGDACKEKRTRAVMRASSF